MENPGPGKDFKLIVVYDDGRGSLSAVSFESFEILKEGETTIICANGTPMFTHSQEVLFVD